MQLCETEVVEENVGIKLGLDWKMVTNAG
jgi:hypothetical protein